jgi:hypothetical protein
MGKQMSSDGWQASHAPSHRFFHVLRCLCLSRINVHNDCLDAESCDLTWPGSPFLPQFLVDIPVDFLSTKLDRHSM